tara:strand:- start:393 stop:527 length:135 start_codon:yes stop_codon:yes gene_type:complete
MSSLNEEKSLDVSSLVEQEKTKRQRNRTDAFTLMLIIFKEFEKF